MTDFTDLPNRLNDFNKELDKIEENLQELYERIRDGAYDPEGDHGYLDKLYGTFVGVLSYHPVQDFTASILGKVIIISRMFVEIEDLHWEKWYA